jgi:hypothetical protein
MLKTLMLLTVMWIPLFFLFRSKLCRPETIIREDLGFGGPW